MLCNPVSPLIYLEEHSLFCKRHILPQLHRGSTTARFKRSIFFHFDREMETIVTVICTCNLELVRLRGMEETRARRYHCFHATGADYGEATQARCEVLERLVV